jgi:hypothetical protein
VGDDEFIDLSAADPSKTFAIRMVSVCGAALPVFVCSVGFEGHVIAGLAARPHALEDRLRALRHRLVDLKPVTEQSCFDPAQPGKWGLKSVLLTLGDGDYRSQMRGRRPDGGDAYPQAPGPRYRATTGAGTAPGTADLLPARHLGDGAAVGAQMGRKPRVTGSQAPSNPRLSSPKVAMTSKAR